MKAKFLKLLPVLLAVGAFFGISPPVARAQQTLDFGDAPTTNYPTLLAQNGARHTVNAQIRLGALIDTEANGQPNSTATGDDTNPPTSDDEDGVTIPAVLLAGQVATIQVQASVSGFLNAWLDFNADGDWADPGEQIFINNALPAGLNNRAFSVPSTARIGFTYARFRFTTDNMNPPAVTGLAPNGEVEDYRVQIGGLDFGDARTNNYPTMLSQDGARHTADPTFCLGAIVDSEPDGQPNADATGDDIQPVGSADDEDGILFLTQLNPGSSANVRVTTTIPVGQVGRLDAWVDFNSDGDWADSGEQIFLNAAVSPGVNNLSFSVPGTAVSGTTFSRFRLSRQGGLRFSGSSPDGEVEDYVVQIGQLDFGDAPDQPYPTLAPNGASHTIISNFFLGARVDGEPNGQPNAVATGDDANPSAGPDDEDGVTFSSPLSPGQPATVEVFATFAVGSSARLDAWIDFNGNGSWLDAGEQIFLAVALAPGVNNLNFNVPASAKLGGTFARFRLGRQGGLRPEGFGQDGEVEDYQVTIEEGLDFGDAPDQPYPTLLANNGARHTIVQGFHLGEFIDPEGNGQPTAAADGDDSNPSAGPDDEDGVQGSGPLVAGQSYTIQVTAVGAAFSPAYLNAWVDFNGNGSWLDAGEQIFVSQVLNNGVNTLAFNVPAGAKVGETYARFRYSHERILRPDGPAQDGEVEDYRVAIINDRDRCDLSCEGTDFWLTFPGNYAPDPDNPVRPSLCVVGGAGVNVKVEIPGLGFVTNRTIPAGILTVSIALPSAADLGDLNDSVTNKGVHVTATGPVAVYAISKVRYTSDSYLAMNTSLLGNEYIVLGWANLHTGAPPLNGSQLAIVAPEDNTTVSIKPSYNTEGHPAGVNYSIVLNAGDTYQLRNTDDSPADLTGTVIISDKPIGVYGSHRCANIPSTNQWFCDYIVEMLPPVNQWGVNHFTAPLNGRTGGDTFRVLASENNTTVSLDGVPLAVPLQRGDHRQFSFPSTIGRRISADKPILVAQYAKSADADPPAGSNDQGDPFMSIVPATRHYKSSYTVCSFTNGFGDNFLNIVAPDGILGTVTLNGGLVGAGAFTPIVGSGYSFAQVTVAAARNTVSAGGLIAVWAYGWNEYESYGHPACLFVGDVRPPSITCNTSNVTVVLTGGPQGECTTSVPDLLQSVTTDDNCTGRQGITVTQDPPRGTPVGPGEHPITLTARDISGNKASCTTTLTVIDPSPVTIFCPSNIIASCTSSNGARVNYTVTARSFCDTNVPVVCNPPSGSLFPPGKTEVICNATSLAGQKDTCAFTVEVRCAGGLTIHRTGNNTYTVTWTGSPGTLQQATDLNGVWSPVVSGVNAYSGTFGGNQLFFRVLY